jgi:hypothetical protein
MNKAIPLSLLFLSSCASIPHVPACPRQFPDVNEDILPFFQMFEGYTGTRIIGITAGLVPIPYSGTGLHTIGVCRYNTGPDRSYREIQLDSVYWSKASLGDKEALVYHELGHCFMELGHDDTKDENGAPNSLMSPVMPSTLEYLDNREYYILELKHKTSPGIDDEDTDVSSQ